MQHTWCFSNEDMRYTVAKMQGRKQAPARHGRSAGESDKQRESEIEAETNRQEDSEKKNKQPQTVRQSEA